MNQKNICEGCLTYSECGICKCSVKHTFDNENCPCSTCLVKMVCNTQRCHILITYTDKYDYKRPAMATGGRGKQL